MARSDTSDPVYGNVSWSNPSAAKQNGAIEGPHPGAVVSPTVRRGLPAWLLSLLLHGLIMAAAVLLLMRFQNGGSEIANRSGGIVLVNMQSQSTEYLSEGDVDAAASPQIAVAPSTSSPAAPELDLPTDLPGWQSSPDGVEGIGESVMEAVPGMESLTAIASNPGKVGGKVTTEVFGVPGTGTRFVYVFDRSQSMAGFDRRPMLAARQQLIKSIRSLPRVSQFQIIFYNDQTRSFNPDGQAGVYFADDQNKNDAESFVKSVQPNGGTDHLNALKAAFRLSPDVIFLLTDAEGGFTADELRQVVEYNRSAAVINTIEFGQRQGMDRSLEQISKTSGGQYLFKNIQTLRLDR